MIQVGAAVQLFFWHVGIIAFKEKWSSTNLFFILIYLYINISFNFILTSIWLFLWRSPIPAVHREEWLDGGANFCSVPSPCDIEFPVNNTPEEECRSEQQWRTLSTSYSFFLARRIWPFLYEMLENGASSVYLHDTWKKSSIHQLKGAKHQYVTECLFCVWLATLDDWNWNNCVLWRNERCCTDRWKLKVIRGSQKVTMEKKMKEWQGNRPNNYKELLWLFVTKHSSSFVSLLKLPWLCHFAFLFR